MKEKNQVVPDEMLSKEFLSQFKTEADVSKFLKQLHAQVLEKMLEGAIRRKSRPSMEKLSSLYPVIVTASLSR